MALLRWIHLRKLVPIEEVIADLHAAAVARSAPRAVPVRAGVSAAPALAAGVVRPRRLRAPRSAAGSSRLSAQTRRSAGDARTHSGSALERCRDGQGCCDRDGRSRPPSARRATCRPICATGSSPNSSAPRRPSTAWSSRRRRRSNARAAAAVHLRTGQRTSPRTSRGARGRARVDRRADRRRTRAASSRLRWRGAQPGRAGRAGAADGSAAARRFRTPT